LLKLAQGPQKTCPSLARRTGVGKVARVRRIKKNGHLLVVLDNGHTLLYRNRKELQADDPVMDILAPYRNSTQTTLAEVPECS